MVINIPNDDGDRAKIDAAEKGGGCSSGGCSTGSCGEGLEKIYPTAAVRYGYMKHVGEFRYPNKNMRFGCGAKVIIQTRRGIELGEMVSLTCDGCDKCVTREQIKNYVDASGPEYYEFSNGKILRLASESDLSDWEHIRAETLTKKRICQQRAEQHNLRMKVIECEHLFGGERIIFYFMAEGRVDFRTLVREIAGEFQTRIEMRQVGARDEARLLADYETCGRECCCKTFLKQLKPVSMKMAKMQKATLDPAKVSGRCGRLKCCLRYEHTTYEELDRKLPRHGARVQTEHGAGMVVGRQILTQLLQIRTEEGGMFSIPVEELNKKPTPVASKRPEPPVAKPSGEKSADRPPRRDRQRPRRPKPDDRPKPAPQGDSPNMNAAKPGAADDVPKPDTKPPHNPESKGDGGAPKARRGNRRGRRRGRGRGGPRPPKS